MAQIFARRAGRIAFGAVLLAGVPPLVSTAWSSIDEHHGATRPGCMEIVVATWLCAVIAGAAVRVIAARRRGSADPEALLAASLMVPAAGIALLLPITLHLPVVVLLAEDPPAFFDGWVGVSAVITGLTHLVFAILSMRRARQLVAGKPAISPGEIYAITVIVSCLPFLVLLLPPLLVAITGLPFIPMLRAMERWVARERAEVAAAVHELPRAVAALRSGA